MLTRKRIVFGGKVLAICCVLVGGFFLVKYFSTRLATRSVNSTLDAKSTKDELAKGECSDSTEEKLSSVNTGAESKTVAKAYEARGLCFVYAKDYEAAKKAYLKAEEEYTKAGMSQEAENAKAAANGVDSLLSAQKAQKQIEESKQDPNAAVGGS